MGEEAPDRRDFARLRALIRTVCSSSLTEFELAHGDLRISIKRREHVAASPPARAEEPLTATDEAATEGADDVEEHLVVAPLAGTVYLRPSPSEKPFASEGDVVEEGQLVALIEAMKMFNEVHAVIGGQVSRLMVSNGQSVAAGSPIMSIVLCAQPAPWY